MNKNLKKKSLELNSKVLASLPEMLYIKLEETVLLYRLCRENFQGHWLFRLGSRILRSNQGSLQVRLDLDGCRLQIHPFCLWLLCQLLLYLFATYSGADLWMEMSVFLTFPLAPPWVCFVVLREMWDVSTTIEWTPMKCWADAHVPLRMTSNFGVETRDIPVIPKLCFVFSTN